MEKSKRMYQMMRNFLVVASVLFTCVPTLNAAVPTLNAAPQGAIDEEFLKIDELTNKAFGNIAGMKALITALRAKNQELMNEIANLKSGQQRNPSPGSQSSTPGVSRETSSNTTNANVTAYLNLIVTKLESIRTKLEKTSASSNEEFQTLDDSSKRLFTKAYMQSLEIIKVDRK